MKHRSLIYGQPLPQDFLDALQELLATTANNLRLTVASSTTVSIIAGTADAQVSVGIDGLWRYNTATVTAAHPAGGAGQYDILVVASANSFVAGGGNETDNTDYSFGLQIVATGGSPTGTWNGRTIVAWRKVGETTWTGSAISAVTNGIVQPAPVTAISGSGTLALRPAASTLPNGFYYATDQDVNYRSDGTTWSRVGSHAGDLILTMNAVAETGRVLLQGQNVSRAGIYADLFAKWGTTYGIGDGATTFGLPDWRGRIPAIQGTHIDVSTPGTSDGITTVSSRRPRHKHTFVPPAFSGNPGSTGTESLDHSHFVGSELVGLTPGGTTYKIIGNSSTFDSATTGKSSTHTHNFTPTGSISGGTVGPQTGSEPLDGAAWMTCQLEAKL